MPPALHLDHVWRSFGSVQAVRDLDLRVERGSVTVLLGPNGAGKTTTFRLATGVLRPDRGAVATLGLSPGVDGQEIRRRTGVVPPKPALYDRLTGRANLAYAARLYDLADPPIDDLAERFGILGALDRAVGGYSTGMRTRLALARALLHDPELLLLDEPTAGLDPESAHSVRSVIFDFAGAGRTVVMATHLLHEADGTADVVVMMDEGAVWESGSPAELAHRYADGHVVRLRLGAPPPPLGMLAGVRSVTAIDGVIEVVVEGAAVVPSLVRALVEAQVPVEAVVPAVPTLESLYFRMRGGR